MLESPKVKILSADPKMIFDEVGPFGQSGLMVEYMARHLLVENGITLFDLFENRIL